MERKQNPYDSKWRPENYLKEYYAPGVVTEDEKHVLKYCVDFVKKHQRTYPLMLEMGCGPTVHHVAPFASVASAIHMADYLRSNLDSVRAWLHNSQAHDWKSYLCEVLSLEGKGESHLEEMVLLIQSKVCILHQGDVLNTLPIADSSKFNLVTSFFCMENASTKIEDWRRAMLNVSSMVAGDGHMIVSALRNTHSYSIGNTEFPTAYVNEEEMQSAFLLNGFADIDVRVCESPSCSHAGFSSIVIASGRKTIF
jgi:hypothetical protein